MQTTGPASLDVASLLCARYGTGDLPAGVMLNETIAGLLAHRSVRAFSDRPLPEGLLATVVAAAQSAPTSSNLQAWSVVAVQDPATRAALAASAGGQKHVAAAPLVLVWLADLARLEDMGRHAGVPTDALAYLEMLTIGMLDAALAAQNASVALESLGLGTVYIGGLRNDPEAVARLLALPPNVMAVFGLCVGYPDPARPADVKPRLPQRVVLHRERYDSTLSQEAIAAYDAALLRFQSAQGMPLVGWIRTALQRVAGASSLSGRDKMRAALQALGFGLK